MKHIRTSSDFQENESFVAKLQDLVLFPFCCNSLIFSQVIISMLIIVMFGCGEDPGDTLKEDEESEMAVPVGMVLIPEGPFEMGSTADIANINEQPVHTVYVDAFYMDKREVSVGAYRKFIEATGHRAPEWHRISIYSPADNHPVVFVSWHDAMAYAKWKGKRLPTEAEWEKAARGGLVGKAYPWGNFTPRAACNFADKRLVHYWWADKDTDDGYGYTAPLGSYPANGYDLYDMAGNVWEWCLDEYDPGFYATSPGTNPVSGIGTVAGITNGFSSVQSPRVLRGGSWLVNYHGVRNAFRFRLDPSSMSGDVGFRCVQDLMP